MERNWPRVEPNGVDERSARRMETNLKRSLAAFEEYEKKARKSGQGYNLKWLTQRRLDLEDEFQNSVNKFESLNKAFQPKVEIMINKVKFALLKKDPIAPGKIDKARAMEGKNPVASDSNGSSQSQRIKSMHEAENKMQLELEE
jgi:hypothetical protein